MCMHQCQFGKLGQTYDVVTLSSLILVSTIDMCNVVLTA